MTQLRVLLHNTGVAPTSTQGEIYGPNAATPTSEDSQVYSGERHTKLNGAASKAHAGDAPKDTTATQRARSPQVRPPFPQSEDWWANCQKFMMWDDRQLAKFKAFMDAYFGNRSSTGQPQDAGTQTNDTAKEAFHPGRVPPKTTTARDDANEELKNYTLSIARALCRIHEPTRPTRDDALISEAAILLIRHAMATSVPTRVHNHTDPGIALPSSVDRPPADEGNKCGHPNCACPPPPPGFGYATRQREVGGATGVSPRVDTRAGPLPAPFNAPITGPSAPYVHPSGVVFRTADDRARDAEANRPLGGPYYYKPPMKVVRGEGGTDTLAPSGLPALYEYPQAGVHGRIAIDPFTNKPVTGGSLHTSAPPPQRAYIDGAVLPHPAVTPYPKAAPRSSGSFSYNSLQPVPNGPFHPGTSDRVFIMSNHFPRATAPTPQAGRPNRLPDEWLPKNPHRNLPPSMYEILHRHRTAGTSVNTNRATSVVPPSSQTNSVSGFAAANGDKSSGIYRPPHYRWGQSTLNTPANGESSRSQSGGPTQNIPGSSNANTKPQGSHVLPSKPVFVRGPRKTAEVAAYLAEQKKNQDKSTMNSTKATAGEKINTKPTSDMGAFKVNPVRLAPVQFSVTTRAQTRHMLRMAALERAKKADGDNEAGPARVPSRIILPAGTTLTPALQKRLNELVARKVIARTQATGPSQPNPEVKVVSATPEPSLVAAATDAQSNPPAAAVDIVGNTATSVVHDSTATAATDIESSQPAAAVDIVSETATSVVHSQDNTVAPSDETEVTPSLLSLDEMCVAIVTDLLFAEIMGQTPVSDEHSAPVVGDSVTSELKPQGASEESTADSATQPSSSTQPHVSDTEQPELLAALDEEPHPEQSPQCSVNAVCLDLSPVLSATEATEAAAPVKDKGKGKMTAEDEDSSWEHEDFELEDEYDDCGEPLDGSDFVFI